jgi:ADP-ribosyl-[dinitrogen reductase] hydrolase
MRQRRAPGNTCMSALRAGGHGTIDARANDSKGCGGVMRTAPIGLITAWNERTAFDVGARASAISHGHPSGYLSGGAMAAMVRLLVGGAELEDAAERTIEIAGTWSESEETLAAIGLALDLAKKPDHRPEDAIRSLGQGWVGEEALAIRLYAALVGGSFAETLVIAANHDGDSNSTASIAGQLFGAWKGVTEIPHAWVRRLDVIEPIYEIMGGLLSACSQCR